MSKEKEIQKTRVNDMTDDADVLLKIVEDQLINARNTELQRATITNFVIVISAAIIGFFATKGVNQNSLPLAIFLVLLGVYGAIFCLKLYERWHLNVKLAKRWRDRIAELHPEARIDELRGEAIKEHEREYPILHKIRVHHLWIIFNILIAIIGLFYIYLIKKG